MTEQSTVVKQENSNNVNSGEVRRSAHDTLKRTKKIIKMKNQMRLLKQMGKRNPKLLKKMLNSGMNIKNIYRLLKHGNS